MAKISTTVVSVLYNIINESHVTDNYDIIISLLNS
jgi:hypothetical protein